MTRGLYKLASSFENLWVFNPYPGNIFLVWKYYICGIYSNALLTTFITEANIMNPDLTAPKGAVWSGVIMLCNKGYQSMSSDEKIDKNWREWQERVSHWLCFFGTKSAYAAASPARLAYVDQMMGSKLLQSSINGATVLTLRQNRPHASTPWLKFGKIGIRRLCAYQVSRHVIQINRVPPCYRLQPAYAQQSQRNAPNIMLDGSMVHFSPKLYGPNFVKVAGVYCFCLLPCPSIILSVGPSHMPR